MKQNVCWLLENPNAASQIAQAGYEAAIRMIHGCAEWARLQR